MPPSVGADVICVANFFSVLLSAHMLIIVPIVFLVEASALHLAKASSMTLGEPKSAYGRRP